MRYQIILLSLLTAGILGMAQPAPADYEDTYSYNLQRTEIHGTVESVYNQECYILTDDGAEVGVQLGPQSYWTEHGYYLPEGAYVDMEVWYDPDKNTDWYFAGEIWGDGFHMVLTNDYGVPYWVMYDQDYYYTRGYRASCVSYMVWYDLPPVYFVYLILPPPPPRYYTCYYGPRWQHHYSDWYWGPRYGQHGSYWRDGRGYERPQRREYAGGPRGDQNDPRWDRPNPAPQPTPRTVSPARPITRPGPRGMAPAPSPRQRSATDDWMQRPGSNERPRKGAPLPREPKYLDRRYQDHPVTPPPERKRMVRPEPRQRQMQDQPVTAPRSRDVRPEPRQRQMQDRPVSPPRSRDVRPEPRRNDNPPPSRSVERPSNGGNRSIERPSNGNNRSSNGNRGQERGRGRR